MSDPNLRRVVAFLLLESNQRPLLRVLNRRAASGLRGRVAVYVAAGSALIAFCGALAVLDAERSNPEANIATFGDAIW